jgi:ABC-type oligopeptide transport system ATPase subunit
MIQGKQRPTVVAPNGALLKVQNLKKYFPIKGGLLQTTVANVKAVDDVSFEIKARPLA